MVKVSVLLCILFTTLSVASISCNTPAYRDGDDELETGWSTGVKEFAECIMAKLEI